MNQVLIFKHLFWNLNKEEIDFLNILINIVERNDSFSSEDFDYKSLGYIIDTNFHELSSSLGLMELDIDLVMKVLENLASKLATVYHAYGDNVIMNKASFIHQYNISSTNNDINKRLTIVVNPSLIKILREHKFYFDLFYKFDAYNLKSKYSKIIYERFYRKDRTTEEFELSELSAIIDFGLNSKEWDWARLNSNVLKRIAKELNDKTDMKFTYSKVKTKVENTKRVQTTKVLITTEMMPDDKSFGTYFSDAFLMERKVAYYIERDINQKFKDVSRFKTKDIKDKSAYLQKMRSNAMKLKDEYKAMVSLQEWLNNIKYSNRDHEGLVVLTDFSKDNHFITVNNNYKLYDIDKKIELSSSARDTRIKISEFMQKQQGEYDIVETGDYLKECSISYTNG